MTHREIEGVDYYISRLSGGGQLSFEIIERDPFDLPDPSSDRFCAVTTAINVELGGEVVQQVWMMGDEEKARDLLIGWLRGDEPTGEFVDYADVNFKASQEFWDGSVPVRCIMCQNHRDLEREVDLTKANPEPTSFDFWSIVDPTRQHPAG